MASVDNDDTASLLHHQLFYAKWLHNEDRGRNASKSNVTDDRVMIFDSQWHFEREEDAATDGSNADAEDDGGDAADNVNVAPSLQLSEEQQALALDRRMEAMARRQVERMLATRRRGRDDDDVDDASIMFQGGVQMPMVGPPVPHNINNNNNANNVANDNIGDDPPAANGGIAASIAAAMRRAFGGEGPNNNNQDNNAQQPDLQQRDPDGQPRPRRQRRLDDNDNNGPQAVHMHHGVVELVMAQGPDGRMIPIGMGGFGQMGGFGVMPFGPPQRGGPGGERADQNLPNNDDNNNNNYGDADGNNEPGNAPHGIAAALGAAFHQFMQQQNQNNPNAVNDANNANPAGPNDVPFPFPFPIPNAGAQAADGDDRNNPGANNNNPPDDGGRGNDGNANANNIPANIPMPQGLAQAIGEALGQALGGNIPGHDNNNDGDNTIHGNNNGRPGRMAGGMQFGMPGGGHAHVEMGFGPMPGMGMMMRMPNEFDEDKPKWNLETLQTLLTRTYSTATTMQLCALEGSWETLSAADWKQVCRTLATALPNITRIEICYTEYLSDDKWTQLLQHFPNIAELDMKHIGDMPITCRQVGLLTQLESLSFQDERNARTSGSGLSPDSCVALAASLKQLSRLSELTLKYLLVQQVSPCWKPLLTTIRSIPTITQLHINGGWQCRRNGEHPTMIQIFRAPQILQRINLSAHNIEKMQYGPRICAAQKMYLKKKKSDDEDEQPSLEDWVHAIIAVRDRLDCVHYFLSEMDPYMFAKPALEAAQCRRRIQEQTVADEFAATNMST